jgi:hypothetical protein
MNDIDHGLAYERQCKAVLEKCVELVMKYGPEDVNFVLQSLETTNDIVNPGIINPEK